MYRSALFKGAKIFTGAAILSVLIVQTESWLVGRLVAARLPSSSSISMPRRMFQSKQESETEKESSASQKNEQKNDSFQIQTRNPFRLAVLRLGLTEPAATSPLNYGKYDGIFSCAYCDQPLFDSNSKYNSGSGWPSFWRTIDDNAVKYKTELDGRLECQCKRCSR